MVTNPPIPDGLALIGRFSGEPEPFCPSTRFGLIFRNLVANLLNVGPLATLALSSELKDDIQLPNYSREPESGSAST